MQLMQTEICQQDWIKLHNWYRKPLGKLFAKAEAATLASLLPALFGYHILAVGVPSGLNMLSASPISRQYHLDCMQSGGGALVDLAANPACLPVASDSIDVVVACHVLEFSVEPQLILKEIDRILIPEGHVIILGFNPWSLWGLWVLWRLRKDDYIRRMGLSAIYRLRAQLSLLGYDIVAARSYCHRPPLNNSELLDKLLFMERLGAKGWSLGGGGYALLAKKRVSTLTPVKPHWWLRRRMPTESVVNRNLEPLEGKRPS